MEMPKFLYLGHGFLWLSNIKVDFCPNDGKSVFKLVFASL